MLGYPITTDRMFTKLYKHQDSVHATTHFEFQVDISILAPVSKELVTQPYQKKKAFAKKPTPPIAFKMETQKIFNGPTIK